MIFEKTSTNMFVCVLVAAIAAQIGAWLDTQWLCLDQRINRVFYFFSASSAIVSALLVFAALALRDRQRHLRDDMLLFYGSLCDKLKVLHEETLAFDFRSEVECFVYNNAWAFRKEAMAGWVAKRDVLRLASCYLKNKIEREKLQGQVKTIIIYGGLLIVASLIGLGCFERLVEWFWIAWAIYVMFLLGLVAQVARYGFLGITRWEHFKAKTPYLDGTEFDELLRDEKKFKEDFMKLFDQ